MRPKLLIAPVLAAAALAAAAAPASATTFCVPTFHPACPNNGTNVAQANLETAMSTSGTDGIPDTVLVAAGTQTDTDSLKPAGSDPLTVRGAGPAQTFLTSSSVTNGFVVDLYAGGNLRAITLEDLTILIPASFPDNSGAGAQVSNNDTLDNVDVVSLNPGAEGVPSIVGDATFRDGSVRGESGGSIAVGFRVGQNAGAVTIATSEINATTTGISHGSPVGASAPLSVRRVAIAGTTQPAIAASAGTTNIENVVINTAANTHAIAATANSPANVVVNVDHMTAVSAGGNADALNASVNPGFAGDVDLTVRSSIMRGFVGAYLRQAPTGAGTGDSDLTINYSNFPVGTTVSNGDGTLDVGTGNIDADPLFVSPANLQIKPGSPSIDKGRPGPGPAEDFLGAPRPVDGDSTPGAVRDQGAYEYQPPPPPDTTPPQTTITKKPKKKLKKRTATFAFASSEADSTFRCRLDSKPERACSSPVSFKRLKRGKHVFQVAATDKAGNKDASPATYSFKVKIKKKKRK